MTHRRIGYLVSQYPAVNHTFILREIRGLRTAGWEVETVSVRKADRAPEAMTAEEREEFAATFSIFGTGKGALAATILGQLLRHPWRFVSGWLFALRLAGFRPALWPAYTAYFLEAVIAAAWFRSHGIRHFHTHFSSTVALILSRTYGISFSQTIHGPVEFDDVVGFHLAEKVAAARLSVAISSYGMSQLQRASAPEHWHKIVALRLGVDLSAFAARPPVAESQGCFELLFVGRLEPPKAQHVTVRAVRLLRDRGHTVRLSLVGPGSMRDMLAALAKELDVSEFVDLAGPQHNDKVKEYYRRCGAFVCASFAEGVPVVLMEALSMEVPCVSTWITGIPELIRDGVDGLLVPPADPVALADAVERLIRDPELGRRLGQSGRQRVLDRFNLDRNIPALAETFERLL